jgi:ribonuclease H / adenosylcobalamin/alpha-ribazole phosphatase
MRLVHLVRHATHDEVGRVLSGRSEIALNATGRAQAASLALSSEGTAIASIHSSPRRRAMQTAQPLADARGLQVQVAPALDEIDFGAFTGRGFATLDEDPDWYRWNAERATARCPGGETMGEAIERAVRYLYAIPPASTPALCVTHCDIIRGVVADLMGMPLDRVFSLDCEPASWTTLALDAGNVRLVTLNRQVPR